MIRARFGRKPGKKTIAVIRFTKAAIDLADIEALERVRQLGLDR